MINKLNKLLGKEFTLEADDEDLETFFDMYTDQRLVDNPISLTLRDEKTGRVSEVDIQEAFECCGKLYAFGFEIADRRSCDIFLKAIEIIAEWLGYSYIGFVHQEDHRVIEVAKELDYKELVNFMNRRSGNRLSEMCKILE